MLGLDQRYFKALTTSELGQMVSGSAMQEEELDNIVLGVGEDGEIKFSLDPFETETQFLFGSFSVLFCNKSKYLNTVDFDSSIFTLSSSFNNLIFKSSTAVIRFIIASEILEYTPFLASFLSVI